MFDRSPISRSCSRGVLVALAIAIGLGGSTVGCKKKPRPATVVSKIKATALARAAAAPRPPPPPPRNADGSYTVAGLTYMETVTGGAQPGETLPMVVGLHPHGGTDTFYEKYITAYYKSKARFITPRGPYPTTKGYEWTPKSGEMTSKQAAEFLPLAIGRLFTSLKEIQRIRPTVGRPMVMGFSNGANMSYGFARLKGDSFAGFCIMAGHLPSELLGGARATSTAPELHSFYGDKDPAITEGRKTFDAMKKLGYAGDIRVFHGVGHEFEPVARDILACIERGIVKETVTSRH